MTLAVTLGAASAADPAAREVVPVVVASESLEDVEVESLEFKLRVLLRNAGFVPSRRDPEMRGMPAASDPWLVECLQASDCLPGLSAELGAERLLLVVIQAEGSFYEGWIQGWSGRIRTQLHHIPRSSVRNLAVEVPRLATAAVEELRSVATALPSEQSVSTDVAPTTAGAAGDVRAAESAAVADEPAEPRRGREAPRDPAVALAAAERGEPAEEQQAPGVLATPAGAVECIDIFAQQSPEPAATAELPVFVKPKVLLLPVAGLEAARASNRRIFTSNIQEALLGRFRLERIDYVVHCGERALFDADGQSVAHRNLALAQVRNRTVHGVDWVLALTLDQWDEQWEEGSYAIESELTLEIYRVDEGSLVLDRRERVAVPEILDLLTFSAQDAAQEAESAALDAAAGTIPASTKTSAALELAGDLVDTAEAIVGESPQEREYRYRVQQNLAMAGDKLALALEQHPRFRLASPVVDRVEDEVGVAVGLSEGVRFGDTYLFYKQDPADWSGFGRVGRLGPGGIYGQDDPTRVEVISDYDEGQRVQAIEYPQLGIQIGATGGLTPVRYYAGMFATNPDATEGWATTGTKVGAPVAGFDVHFRIPWLPVGELYEINAVHLGLSELNLLLGSINVGLEKRWLWGRWTPLIGAYYALGFAGVPIPDPAGSEDLAFATATDHGIGGHLGMGFFLHPAVTVSLRAGYRYFFAPMTTFSNNGDELRFRCPDGSPWTLSLSGVSAQLTISYEM